VGVPPQQTKIPGGNNQDFSELFIYSIQNNRTIKTWVGNGVKNFLITDGLLIFDNGIRNNSSIEIFNYKTLEEYFSIHMKSGCSLKSIL
jgi:hypothetical protein